MAARRDADREVRNAWNRRPSCRPPALLSSAWFIAEMPPASGLRDDITDPADRRNARTGW